jgi:DNA replication protein DnaC
MPFPEPPAAGGAATECSECGGRGWIIEPDAGRGTARPCSCRERFAPERLRDAAGIPPRYARCRLDNFKVEVAGHEDSLLRALTLSTRYVDEFLTRDGYFREGGLLYSGRPGVGKTHLAAATLLALIERYRIRGRFVDFTSLIYQIRSTFDPENPESKRAVLDPVIRADVLVLDELGAQKPTAWVGEILYLILNSRYTQRRPTLFTTNYGLPEGEAEDRTDDRFAMQSNLLSSRIPSMLVSRLYEMAQPVVIESVDHRQKVKMYQHHLE